MGGVAWALVHPLLLLGFYTLVFAGIFRVRLAPDAGPEGFAFFLFAGMLPWLAFQEALNRACASLLEQAPLIKRHVFPVEVLPLVPTVSTLVQQLIGLGVLLMALAVLGRLANPWTLTVLPLLLALQWGLTAGGAWVVASLNVFVRDVGHAVAAGLVLLAFLTPIFYPPTLLPPELRFLLKVNPLAPLLGAYRAVILAGQLPAPGELATVGTAALLLFPAGFLLFRRLKPGFADVL